MAFAPVCPRPGLSLCIRPASGPWLTHEPSGCWRHRSLMFSTRKYICRLVTVVALSFLCIMICVSLRSSLCKPVHFCSICFFGFTVDFVDLFRHWPFLHLLSLSSWFQQTLSLLLQTYHVLQWVTCCWTPALDFFCILETNSIPLNENVTDNYFNLRPWTVCWYCQVPYFHIFLCLPFSWRLHLTRWQIFRIISISRCHGETPSVHWQKQWLLYNIIYHPGAFCSASCLIRGASSQRRGGILVDVPVRMLNDSDTKRGPRHAGPDRAVFHRAEAWLDLKAQPQNQITAPLLTPLWPGFDV